MSQQNSNINDPLALIRQMWSNLGFNLPGMVVPTLDSDELGKRIADLKAVEGWLSMNLSMLQMTIRSLEMQRTTIETVKAMGEMAAQAGSRAAESVGAAPAAQVFETAEGDAQPPGMWPWAMMQQIQEYLQQQAASVVAAAAPQENAAEAGEAVDKSADKKRKSTNN